MNFYQVRDYLNEHEAELEKEYLNGPSKLSRLVERLKLDYAFHFKNPLNIQGQVNLERTFIEYSEEKEKVGSSF